MPNFSKIGDGRKKNAEKGVELTWNVPTICYLKGKVDEAFTFLLAL